MAEQTFIRSLAIPAVLLAALCLVDGGAVAIVAVFVATVWPARASHGGSVGFAVVAM